MGETQKFYSKRDVWLGLVILLSTGMALIFSVFSSSWVWIILMGLLTLLFAWGWFFTF